MKASYCLVGLIWDHKPIANLERPISFDGTVPPLGAPDCLFDRIAKRRTILASDLLSVETQEEVDVIVRESGNCDEIDVILDCIPPKSNDVHSKFCWLRLAQAARRLIDANPDCKVVLMASPEEA